jgi:hypothetical protein
MPFDVREFKEGDEYVYHDMHEPRCTVVMNEAGYVAVRWPGGKGIYRHDSFAGISTIGGVWRNSVQIYPPLAPKWTPKPGEFCVDADGVVFLVDDQRGGYVKVLDGTHSLVNGNLAPLPQPDLNELWGEWCDTTGDTKDFLRDLQNTFWLIPKSGRVEGVK